MGCCWWDTMRSDIVVYRDGIFWKMLEYITKLWYLGPPEIFLIRSPGRKLWMIGPHFGPTDPQSHISNCPEICYSTPKMPMLIGKKRKNHWIFDHFLEPWPHIGGMENFLPQSLSSNHLHGAPVMSIHGIQQKFWSMCFSTCYMCIP